MTYNPAQHHRRSIRLRGYDYARAGAYFVTICTQQRECLFGDIIGGEMRLNAAGQIVAAIWQSIPRHFPNVTLEAWVIMPNHLHGIIVIGDPCCPDRTARNPVRCPPSCKISNRYPRAGLTGRAAHRVRRCGNVIITNASSVTRPP